MAKFLRELLDAEEPIFTQSLQQLESASGRRGIDAQLIGDITAKAHESMRIMGLDPLNTTGQELYRSLLNRVEADIKHLGKVIGAKEGDNSVAHLVPLMIDAANKVEFPRRVFVLKRDKAKELLRKMPPKTLMEHLGYDDVEQMFAGEDFDEIYTALRFSEGPEWLNKYDELFETVTADDYEERDIRIVQMDHDKYVDLAEHFVQKKLHNVTHTKEMGIIVVVPMRVKTMRGLLLKTLPLLLHYMNEIKLYSTFFKLKSKKPHFGRVVMETLIADPGNASQMAGNKIHWRVIQRYLGKHKEDSIDKVAFEPHVQPEDLHWRRAEDLLYKIDPELEFWKDRDYVALNYDGFPVAFNLLDVSFAYSNQESYEGRYAYHFRESLWNEIFARYMGEKNLEQQVLEQLDNDMIAPEKLPVKKPDTRVEEKQYQESKKLLAMRRKLIDSADKRLEASVDEFAEAFSILKSFDKTVTIFGSARDLPNEWATDTAYHIGKRLAEEGYAVITGGGDSIMAAANRGAYDAGGHSIGLNIYLKHEQKLNPYTTHSFEFKHFFSRKVAMTLYESAYIYLPGGFGTLDELSEILVLKQTGKIDGTPIILVGEMFWRPFDEFVKNTLLVNQTVDKGDTQLYQIVNDVEDVVKIVKSHPQK